MRIGIAQINTKVGDLEGNAARILAAYHALESEGAEIILTPELAITGYPPQDLIFKSRFVPENLRTLKELHGALGGAVLVTGFIDANLSEHGRPFHNAAAVLEKGQPPRVVHKILLPTYDVFDEARYFEPGTPGRSVEIRGKKFGITICEDIWTHPMISTRRLYNGRVPLEQLMEQRCDLMLNLSASPWHSAKEAIRQNYVVADAARALRCPVA
ncbi:MAG TPA: nitrilase-related carbon-nitrogen hydrolase, partial [Terrimicrobiaceae bacterium]|nr:nitrilase-related carbon-nitrogen hydrolase [Terrimicrobiaceae bacterium]